MRLTRAVVRPPGSTFAAGLTTVNLGVPDLTLALGQHEAYVRTLERCGLAVTRLPADPVHPDSTFVEDAAVLLPEGAILTRPGAPSREGEVASIRAALAGLVPAIGEISPPGTLDGGDICEAGRHFLIGLSHRTNEDGARQLASILSRHGYTSAVVDIRTIAGILHLKSGVSYLGGGRLLVIDELHGHPAFHAFDRLVVPDGEEYAANAIRVNDHVVLPAGFPRVEALVQLSGTPVLTVGMSEFRKMDGGPSCLSLRF